MRRAHYPHRGGAAVLLVLGVEDEEQIERLHQRGMGFVLADLPHHVQEVRREAERVVRVDERKAHAEAMAARRERRHLRDQPEDLLVTRLRVEDVLRVVVERRQRRNGRHEHPHRMGVVVEAIHEPLAHVLVDERVMGDVRGPGVELFGVRELAVQQQVGHFEIGRVLGELLDRVAAVAEDARVSRRETVIALADAAVDRNAGSYIRRSGSSSRNLEEGNTPFVMSTVISLPVRLSMMVMVSATLVAPFSVVRPRVPASSPDWDGAPVRAASCRACVRRSPPACSPTSSARARSRPSCQQGRSRHRRTRARPRCTG